MPNIKSAKKRAIQSEKRRITNNARKQAIKTAMKKVLTALEEKNAEDAKEFLKDVQAKLARAQSKGVLHANTASRKLSRLAHRVAQATR